LRAEKTRIFTKYLLKCSHFSSKVWNRNSYFSKNEVDLYWFFSDEQNCDEGREMRCVVELYSSQQSEIVNELLAVSGDLNQQPTIDKLYKQLITDAKDYCLMIENVQDYSNHEWLADMSRILSRIQMAMAHLDVPQYKAEYQALADMDARFELYCQLKEKLGKLDNYWMEYDIRTDFDDQSGSLSGDFSDLYFEFQRGLQASMTADDVGSQAISLWRAGYLCSWGQHLLDAQKHLFTLRVNSNFL
jgi:hypothetical protein